MSRVLLVDGTTAHDIFEVLAVEGSVAKVRSPYLFELGEELKLRIEDDGCVTETTARVRAHVGSADDRVTELELGELTEPRKVVSG